MTRMLTAALAIVAVSLASVAIASPAAASESESPARLIEEMTGRDAVTNTARRWQIEGTDLGIMWDDGNGGVLTAFGDTFGEWSGDGGGGSDWRSNVLLRSTDTDLGDGMSFDWALEDQPGHAGEIVGSKKEPGVEQTTIPTAGISIDGRQFVSYMSVREWGDPGKWRTNFAQLIYSDDGGQTWTDDGAPRWENNSAGTNPFQMHAFAQHGDYLYVFGTPNGRFGAASLARVAADAVLDKDAYEYFTGSGWSDQIADLQPIISPRVAELSVHFDAQTGQWLMVYLNEDVDLVLRTASEPMGPWSEAQVLASSADYPGLYGGYIHPWSPSGELYFAMTLWGGYNVALMKAEYDSDGQLINPNMLSDPSFERTTDFTQEGPWTVQGSAGIDDSIDWAKLGAHQFWLRDDHGFGEIAQTLAVEPNTTYRLSCWVKTGGAGDHGALAARPSPSTDDDQPLLEVGFESLQDWHRLSGTFNSAGNSAIEVYVASSFDAGDRWVQGDDCSLVRVESGTRGNQPTATQAENPDERLPATGAPSLAILALVVGALGLGGVLWSRHRTGNRQP